MRWTQFFRAGDSATLIDTMLSALAASLAVFSASMGIGNRSIAYVMVTWIWAGSLISYGLGKRFKGNAFTTISGSAYAVFCFVAVLFPRQLNHMLPLEGFPSALAAAGVFSWMLTLGSICLSRETTMLFNIVPCIPLFSFVGSWDTYSGATFCFFAFLVCAATLFARSHIRSMMRQAKAAGFEDLRSIREGPWRGIAGPEWAVSSAAVVIVISVVSAPLIQQSVQKISPNISIPLPAAARNLLSSSNPMVAQTVTRIGNGPRELSRIPVMYAGMDKARYLRMSAYAIYTGQGWSGSTTASGNLGRTGSFTVDAPAQLGLTSSTELPYEIEFVGPPGEMFPSPGFLIWSDKPESIFVRADGIGGIQTANRPRGAIKARAIISTSNQTPRDALRQDTPRRRRFTTMDGITSRVKELGRSLASQGGTDYEIAKRIQRHIESTCKYNLETTAVPDNKDAIEHFLFDAKEGYCDMFASSMVALARSAGIPARYVTGFYPTTEDKDEQGRYILYESDAHAWAELFFNDVGWVVFDATEGAEAVEGSGRGDPTYREPWYDRQWVRVGGAIAVALFGLTLLVWAFAPAWSQRFVLSPMQRAQIAVCTPFVRGISQVSKAPYFRSMTLIDVVRQSEAMLQSNSHAAFELAGKLEEAMYGRNADAAALLALKPDVQEFLKKLKETNPKPGRKRP